MGKRSELKAPAKRKKRTKDVLDIGDAVNHLTYEPELQWTITKIWDTNCDGLRAELSRPDPSKKLKVDRGSAQLTELKRIN